MEQVFLKTQAGFVSYIEKRKISFEMYSIIWFYIPLCFLLCFILIFLWIRRIVRNLPIYRAETHSRIEKWNFKYGVEDSSGILKEIYGMNKANKGYRLKIELLSIPVTLLIAFLTSIFAMFNKQWMGSNLGETAIQQFGGFLSHKSEIYWLVQCNSDTNNTERSYNNTDVFVSNCYFSRSFQYYGRGSIIYCMDVVVTMKITFSTFFNCSCSSWGGAIYFDSANVELKMICANSCSAKDFHHFSYIRTVQDNYVEFLSIAYCSSAHFGFNPFMLASGHQQVLNTNSSFNKAFQGGGMGISKPLGFACNFCTISNNSVENSICIYLNGGSLGTFSYLNVVANDSPIQYGIVYVDSSGSYTMQNCNFDKNLNYLFSVSLSGKLTVLECNISHQTSYITKGNINTTLINNQTHQQTLRVQHYATTKYCEALYPYMLPPTIQPTQNNTPEVSHSTALYTVIMILTIIIFIITIFFIISYYNNTHQDSTTSSSPQSPKIMVLFHSTS